MFNFFARVLSRKANKVAKPVPPRNRLRARLNLEELMPRVVPSTSPFLHAAGHHLTALTSHSAHHLLNSHAGTTTHGQHSSGHGVILGAASHSGSHSAAGHHSDLQTGGTTTSDSSLEASLSNSSGATGKAEFDPTSGKLEVCIKGAAANSSLTVAIDGNTAGTITTDASGNGKLELSQSGATAQAGSTITVGDLTGTFAAQSQGDSNNGGSGSSSDGNSGDNNGSSSTELKAPLTGTSGATGSAEFNGGEGQLQVEIKGAAAGTTYNVAVDGTVVGQLITDSSGEAELHLSSASLTVQASSTLTVADTQGNPAILSGTFAQPAGQDD